MYQPSPLADLLPSKPASFPEPDATGRIFLEAAHLIRTHGHTAHYLRTDDGRYCMHGAVEQVRLGENFSDLSCDYMNPVHLRLTAFLEHEGIIPPGTGHGCYWNNAPERTAAEVIDALEAAAFFPATS